MPLRFYDNNDWRSPTSVRVYDNGTWNEASIGYVFELGQWRLIFPDPIIPSIEFTDTYAGLSYLTSPPIYEIGADVKVINGTGQIFAELFLGSTPSGTPIASKNVSAYSVSGNERRYNPDFTSYSFTNNQNYCIRVTARSITENETILSSGAIFLGVPSVQITSFSVPSTNSFSVSWSSQNQSKWLVTISPQSGFGAGYASAKDEFGNPKFTTGAQTSHSASISPPLLGNTQYILKVEVENNNFDTSEDSRLFTSPNDPIPIIDITSVTQTCSTLQVNWTAQNSVNGFARIYSVSFEDLGPGNGTVPVYTEITSKRISWTTQRTATFTGLNHSTQYLIDIIGYNINGVAGPVDNELIETLPPSVNAPTNFSASSDYHGKVASFSWTAATANCTTISGYRIEYKLNTSSTWTLLSNSIASNATTFSAGGIGTSTFLPNRTYNFRIYAKGGSDFYISPPSSAITLTMSNNPYSIVITGTNSINTFSSSVLTAQLRNAAAENVSASGFTVSWSFVGGINPPTGSSVFPTSATTNASGQATTTFSSSSDDGTGTVFATTNNLGPLEGGSRVMTVNLTPSPSPTLSASATTKGVSFNNTTPHSSLYAYSASTGYPFGGTLEPGDSFNNAQFDILGTIIRNTRNTISKSGRTATTTNPTFFGNPFISMSITSSRAGYTTVTGAAVGTTSNISITGSRLYQWQQFTNNTWNTNFGGAFSGMQTATLSWSNTTFSSREIRCQVTTNFSSGQSDTSTSTNTVTIP